MSVGVVSLAPEHASEAAGGSELLRLSYEFSGGADSCYLHGPFDTPRRWEPLVIDLLGWGRGTGRRPKGGFLSPTDCDDIAGRDDDDLTLDGIECEDSLMCKGFVPDGGPAWGMAPHCRLTACDSDPSTRDEACPSADVGHRGTFYTRTVRHQGQYFLVCDYPERVQRTDPETYEVPLPVIHEVTPRISTTEKKVEFDVSYSQVDNLTMTGCTRTGPIERYRSQVSTTFSCLITGEEHRFTLVATRLGRRVEKKYIFRMGDPVIEFRNSPYDQDARGPVEIEYQISREATVNDLVSFSFSFFNLAAWRWIRYSDEQPGDQIGESVKVPWVRSIEVTTRGVRRSNVITNVHRVDPVRRADEAHWKGSFQRSHFECGATLRVTTGNGRSFTRYLDLCDFPVEFRVEPVPVGETCYDFYFNPEYSCSLGTAFLASFGASDGCKADRCDNFSVKGSAVVSGKHIFAWFARCDDGLGGEFFAATRYDDEAAQAAQVERPSLDDYSLQIGSWQKTFSPRVNGNWDGPDPTPMRCTFHALTWNGGVATPVNGDGLEITPGPTTRCILENGNRTDWGRGGRFEQRACNTGGAQDTRVRVFRGGR